MTARAELIAITRQIAERHGLDRQLVCAVIEQESDWEQWAARYEPVFEQMYVARLHLADRTEQTLRSISWGLMQVMGQVARENGFAGALPSLCLPLNGLEVGCKVLAHKLAVNEGNVTRALLAWNGGGNPQYAAEVLARAGNYA